MNSILKTVIFFLIAVLGYSGFSQSDLNGYKYIIVPKKFETFKDANEHQTSTLIKYLLTGKGFNTVYDDDLPSDLSFNRCLALTTVLQDESNLFTTKTTLVLKDCNGKEVFKTMQGTSKEKEYRAGYAEAIKKAMRSFNSFEYAYNGTGEGQAPITVSFENDVKKLKNETPMTKEVTAKKENLKPKPDPAVTQVATETTQYYRDITPVDSDVQKKQKEKPAIEPLQIKETELNDVWYAQAIENGYQLVDSTPTIRMKIFRTSKDTIFIAQTDTTNGMVFQTEGNWVFEYYKNEKLVQQALHIKF